MPDNHLCVQFRLRGFPHLTVVSFELRVLVHPLLPQGCPLESISCTRHPVPNYNKDNENLDNVYSNIESGHSDVMVVTTDQ